MPDKDTFENSMSMLDELEDTLGEEYPDVTDTLMTAKTQLEEAHGAMGEEGEDAEFPPELEGDEELDMEEEEGIPGEGPLGDLPPGLEDEEEEDEEMPAL